MSSSDSCTDTTHSNTVPKVHSKARCTCAATSAATARQVGPHLRRGEHLDVAAEAQQRPRRGHPGNRSGTTAHSGSASSPAGPARFAAQIRPNRSSHRPPHPHGHRQPRRPVLDLPPQRLPQLRELHPVPAPHRRLVRRSPTPPATPGTAAARRAGPPPGTRSRALHTSPYGSTTRSLARSGCPLLPVPQPQPPVGEHRRLQHPELPDRVRRRASTRPGRPGCAGWSRRGGGAEGFGHRPHHLQYGRTGCVTQSQILLRPTGGEHEQGACLVAGQPGHVRPVTRQQPDAPGPAPFGIDGNPGRRQRLGVPVTVRGETSSRSASSAAVTWPRACRSSSISSRRPDFHASKR